MQPPPSQVSFGEPLYEAFYGLREQPFALSTDPRFLFLSASHRRAFEELLTGLRRREGLLLLTGETGTGKTTLCRAIMSALGPRTFSSLILNPYMSDAEVLRVILRDFGLVSREEIRRGAFARADTPQLLDTLESFLRSLVPLDSYALVIVDEAQSLAPRVLDQIRMLGGYEQDGQRLLQILLVGQPSLSQTLKTEPLRALNERITRRAALSPLPLAEIEEYIRHRLTVAGGARSVGFTPEAVQLVAEVSRGLPRRINVLCDRTLEAGQADGATELGPELVRRAAQSIAGTAAPVVEDLDVTFSTEAIPPQTADDRVGALEFTRVEIPITLGTPPASPVRGRFWIFAAIGALMLAAAVVAGGYAWTLNARPLELPPLPRQPSRDLGAPLLFEAVPIPPEGERPPSPGVGGVGGFVLHM